jgi:histone deacetylase 11
VYADITIAIRSLRKSMFPKYQKVMIVDLDAHMGNGHERDFTLEKDTTFIFDMYQVSEYLQLTLILISIQH